MSFLEQNEDLTRAVTSGLGEPVVLTPLSGKAYTVDAIVNRGVELLGTDGRVSGLHDTISLSVADVPGDLDGASVRIGATEQRILDALLAKDAGMAQWSLR